MTPVYYEARCAHPRGLFLEIFPTGLYAHQIFHLNQPTPYVIIDPRTAKSGVRYKRKNMNTITKIWNILVDWSEEVYNFRQSYHKSQFNDRYL